MYRASGVKLFLCGPQTQIRPQRLISRTFYANVRWLRRPGPWPGAEAVTLSLTEAGRPGLARKGPAADGNLKSRTDASRPRGWRPDGAAATARYKFPAQRRTRARGFNVCGALRGREERVQKRHVTAPLFLKRIRLLLTPHPRVAGLMFCTDKY